MTLAKRWAATALICLVALCACTKITEENFAKIEEGMAEQDVLAILGRPTQTDSINLFGLSGSASRWVGRDAVITVQFVNGKVVIKSFNRTGSQ